MTDQEVEMYLSEVDKMLKRDMYDPDMTLELEAKYNQWREVAKAIHEAHPAKRIEPVGDVKWGKTVKAKLDNTQRFYYDLGFGAERY